MNKKQYIHNIFRMLNTAYSPANGARQLVEAALEKKLSLGDLSNLYAIVLSSDCGGIHAKKMHETNQNAEFPKKISFTDPDTKDEIVLFIEDADQADESLDWFFQKYGPDVPYSVDSVGRR